MKKVLFAILLISGVAYGQIDTVRTTDTPNEGRIRINAAMQKLYGYRIDTAGISIMAKPILVLQDSVWIAKEGILVGADSATVPYMVDDDSMGAFQDVNFAKFTFKNPNGSTPNWNMMSHTHDTQTADNILALYHNLTFNGTSFNAKQVASNPAWAMQFESRYDSAVEWNANLWTNYDNPALTYRRIFHMNAYYDSSAFGRVPGDVNWRWWTGKYGVFGIGFDAGGVSYSSGGNEDTTSMARWGHGDNVSFTMRNYLATGITSIQLADSSYGYLRMRKYGRRTDSLYQAPLQYAAEVSSYSYGPLLLGTTSDNNIFFGVNNTRIADLSSGGLGLNGTIYMYAPTPQIQMVSSTDGSRNGYINFGYTNGAMQVKHAYNIHLWPAYNGSGGKVLIGDSTATIDSTLTVNGGLSATNIRVTQINAGKITFPGDTVKTSGNIATPPGYGVRSQTFNSNIASNNTYLSNDGTNHYVKSPSTMYLQTNGSTTSLTLAGTTATFPGALNTATLKVGSLGSIIDSAKVVADTLKFYVGGVAYKAVK